MTAQSRRGRELRAWPDVFGGAGGRLSGPRRVSSRGTPTAVAEADAHPLPGDLPTASVRATGGTVLAVSSVGPSVRVLRVRRPEGWTFVPGQYAKLGLASASSRSYSIASPPHQSDLEFCVRLVPGGKLTPSLFSLTPGSTLQIGPRAKGAFRLDSSKRSHLMVATGTGIAPFRSMISSELHANSAHRFTVVHGASHAHDLPFADELMAASLGSDQLRYVPTVSRPPPRPWSGRSGRAEVVAAELAPDLSRSEPLQVYACGNAGMIDNLERLLLPLGLGVSSEPFY